MAKPVSMNFLLLLSSAVKFIVLLFHLCNPPLLLRSHPVGAILPILEYPTEAADDIMKSSSQSLCQCRSVPSLSSSLPAAPLNGSPHAIPTTPVQKLFHSLIETSLRNSAPHSFCSFKPRLCKHPTQLIWMMT